MHGEIYKLIESMEDVIGRYPVEDLRTLGLELRRHSTKKGLNPFEELVLRRIGGMILEAHKVRQKHLTFVEHYNYGYGSFPDADTELDSRIKTLMCIGQGAVENKKKGRRIKNAVKKRGSINGYFDYMTNKKPKDLGKDLFKFLVKSGYVIATDEHMIATFLSKHCKDETVKKAKALLKEQGYPVEEIHYT